MARSFVVITANPSAVHPAAPAFTPFEKAAIAQWAKTVDRRGLCIEMVANDGFLAEALHVTPRLGDEPRWLVHKTPAGAIAVRLWPGLAEIVPGIDDALAIISAALDRTVAGAILSDPAYVSCELRRPH